MKVRKGLVLLFLLANVFQGASAYSSDEGSASNEGQRLMRLEVALENLKRMNYPSQVADLRDQVQRVQGQLEVVSHSLKELRKKQKSFYLDVDTRLARLSKASLAAASKKPSSHAAVLSGLTPEEIDYQAAYQLMRGKDYEGAKQAFHAYHRRYSKGKLIPNVLFWQGEMAYATHHYDEATNNFRELLDRFPRHQKACGAKYKLGLLLLKRGEKESARREFLAIIDQYPHTLSARLSKKALNRL
jgi:tol-pal system protein YbgF